MKDYSKGVNTPIYPSTTFGISDPYEMAKWFAKEIPEGMSLYGRFGHQNYKDLCVRLSRMEGGESAAVFGSGMAATFLLFFSTLSIGDHIVVSSRIYGGTRGQLAMLAAKLRLKVSVVDMADLPAVERACRKKTKLLFAESISNPEVVVTDIAGLHRICHSKKRNILLAIDNTFGPLIVRPLLLGADVVMHSLTKFVNGMSKAMGGALVGTKTFIDALLHPTRGEAPLIGAVLHPPVAQEMAENFYHIKYRVREASERAMKIAGLFARAGLRTHYPLIEQRPLGVLNGMGFEMGGGVLAIAFPTEDDGVRFVKAVVQEEIDDPLLGPEEPLAINAVSLGSTHTYVWCITEARVQSKATKWPPLPFAPVPYGFVRIAVGYAGDFSLQLSRFETVLKRLGYQIRVS